MTMAHSALDISQRVRQRHNRGFVDALGTQAQIDQLVQGVAEHDFGPVGMP